jgi:hypothetical protein
MEAVEIARQALRARLDDRWDSNRIFLRLVRDDALRTGAFEDALAWYRETQIPGVHGERIFIVDVELLALNGETNVALDSLREAVNGGWKTDWKWHLGNENLAVFTRRTQVPGDYRATRERHGGSTRSGTCATLHG